MSFRPLFARLLAVLLVPSTWTAGSSLAAEAVFGRQESPTGIRHSFLVTGSHTVWSGEAGEVIWQTQERSRDGFVLPDGKILYSNGKQAREVTREGTVVWSWSLSPENRELGTAVRLSDGNTLLVERGNAPRLLEVTATGSVARIIPLQPETTNAHMQTRMARPLPNGHYLVPHLLAFQVKEYLPDGTVASSIRTDLQALGGRAAEAWPFTAIRLPNGNTLVTLTHSNQVVEFAADGSIAWKLDNQDAGGRLADPCGAQRLPNGNTVICCYGQKDAIKPKLIEVTPDRKIVWEFFHPDLRAHEVHVLTTNGADLGTPLK